ncbi:MAG: hypothetical protein ACK5YO_32670, partial [Planctomyces sp.]
MSIGLMSSIGHPMRLLFSCLLAILAMLIGSRAKTAGTIQEDTPSEIMVQLPIVPTVKYSFMCRILDTDEEKIARASR